MKMLLFIIAATPLTAIIREPLGVQLVLVCIQMVAAFLLHKELQDD